MSTVATALHGPGLTPDRVRALAAVCGIPRWTPEDGDSAAAQRPGVVVLFAGDDDPHAAAAALWLPPCTAWIDLTGLSEEALGGIVRKAEAHDLFASLTTAMANDLHLAGRIVAAIDARRPLSESRRDDMELALHEAISNAVVHGNLQVEGMKGVSMEALDRFSSDLAVRMADPAFAGRRLEVAVRLLEGAVTVEVGDEGHGFHPTRRSAQGASGRGLDLIAAIAESYDLLDGGRRIRLRFTL